jgi:2-deoxy-D-gluconate 3-dehydrogenase
MSVLDNFKLNGKTAVVTGCNNGIGCALASALAEAGADIVGVSRQLAETEEASAAVRAQGRSFSAYECDFSDRQALFAFTRQVHAAHPEVDILMNNAGVILRSPAAEFPDEYWDRVIQVNLDAQFFLAREFGRRMVERGHGKIIFTASMLSFQGGGCSASA